MVAVLTLGSTCTFSTATVSASRRTTQAQLEKMEYTGKAKTTKKITAHRIVRTYYIGKAKTIPKGTHIRISSGVGPWNFVITYKGRKYFYQHSTKITTNWFKEI